MLCFPQAEAPNALSGGQDPAAHKSRPLSECRASRQSFPRRAQGIIPPDRLAQRHVVVASAQVDWRAHSTRDRLVADRRTPGQPLAAFGQLVPRTVRERTWLLDTRQLFD